MSEGGKRRRARPTLEQYVEGVRAGNRAMLARAITLVESSRPADQELAQKLLVRVLSDTGDAHRIGITGVPGVGKSTFLDALGTTLTKKGHKVAVLAIDPTSGVSGGSILGDKTRMSRLSVDPNAFVRPSPSSGTLGGVARKTRETMLLCEAAGFDVIFVETVGVGQSETVVAQMVDFFLVLMLASAGDELQGIKRGILELADMIAINKADLAQEPARLARQEYAGALRLMRPTSPNWKPPVVTCSGLDGTGLEPLWELVLRHRRKLTETGELQQKRREQARRWMWSLVEDRLLQALHHHPAVKAQREALERDVMEGRLTATLAATRILGAFGVDPDTE